MDIGAHQHLLHVIWKIGVHTTDGLRGRGAGAAPMSSDDPKLVMTTVRNYDLQETSKLLSPGMCMTPRRLPFTCWARRQQLICRGRSRLPACLEMSFFASCVLFCLSCPCPCLFLGHASTLCVLGSIG
ncbi:hypothetical protein FA15DRAFT_405044 [Coprinopsis marcescibilis]|uniref:Uncharacterized protein n=1 Tax=Coprinopsis marcescibilis TaxID=230819 RepID=A0A5C3KA02_COPMA|nr:hypothetical protein FA15DRAFT_405044 [Coprinopsis marcescibilis]